MAIECLVLGAGQEVGKSCVVVSLGGKKIMFDCGMHMGCVDNPYPDFSRISPSGDFDSVLSCVVITHFHLDHVGALPFFTEVCGYHGPIYMTYPTKALSPLMLEDYRKVMVDRRGEKEQFSYADIAKCMSKVTAVNVKQTIQVDKELQIRAYYAGHVLGAAMFYAKVGENTLVYTGDYNMTPDRHLGSAQIDHLELDLLITESTYATTIRDSKYAREREFLKVVHKCVAGGGKVLIPTFAMGRAQELCILLDDYWERMNLKIPIYFSAGLTIQANMYYKMLVGWTSQKIKDSYGKHNAFDFKHVCPFSRSMIDAPGPCVLFATPGMLTGGFSLEVFKHWAPSEKNLVTLPGYCLAGTIGHKLMSGKATRVDLDRDTQVDVRCQIHQLSFSPHTDAKGIMDLVRFLSPKHVVLVHGEKPNMEKLKGRIQSELGIQCYNPANNETVCVPSSPIVTIDASKMFLKNCSSAKFNMDSNARILAESRSEETKTSLSQLLLRSSSATFNTAYSSAGLITESQSKDVAMSQSQLFRDERVAEGILVMEKTKKAKVIHEDEFLQTLAVEEHKVEFSYCFPLDASSLERTESTHTSFESTWLRKLHLKLENICDCMGTWEPSNHIRHGSLQIRICSNANCPYRKKGESDGLKQPIFFCCTWSLVDEEVARRIISFMKNLNTNTM